MSKVRFNITMSLDGYVAGPKQSVENPLGEGGNRLHDWLFKLKTFRAIHGDANGGETGTNDDVLREAFDNIGATIMGRNMFGGGHGPWGKQMSAIDKGHVMKRPGVSWRVPAVRA
jgi:dihydrofolate reductase